MRIKTLIKTVAAVGALALASAAQAVTVTYDLNMKDPGTTMTVVPSYGTVAVKDTGSNSVEVTVTLLQGYVFVDTGTHYYFAFNSTASNLVLGTATLSSPTTSRGITTLLGAGSYSNPTFGPFDYALGCDTGCGGNNDAGRVLTFTLSSTDTSFSSASFNKLRGTPAAYFSADILGNVTGTVASTCQIGVSCTSVPEPATLGLLGLGLAGVGFARRRKQG